MKAKLSLSIDLSNPVHLTIMTALLAECGKANIECLTTPIEEKAATTKATTKATIEKPAKKVERTATNKREEGDFSTDFDLTLEKDGIHLVLGHHGKGACRAAATKLYGMGLKRNDAYGYYMETKGGKISAKATKEVFDNLGGKLHIANEDYKKRS